MIYKLVRTIHNHYITYVLYSLFVASDKVVQIVNQIEPKDDDDEGVVYIITFCQSLKKMPKRYIVYQLEQMHLKKHNQDKDYRSKLQRGIQCLDYNHENTKYYHSKRPVHNFPVPIARVPNVFLSAYPHGEEPIDLLFYGAMNLRRYKIMFFLNAQLRPFGVRIKMVHNIYGEELYSLIRRSRIVLNIGYYTNTLLATYRINEALVHQRVVFSEAPIHSTEVHVMKEYQKAGVVFVPLIEYTMHNIETDLIRPLLDVFRNKHRYNQLLQQGKQFVVKKERISKQLLNRALSGI